MTLSKNGHKAYIAIQTMPICASNGFNVLSSAVDHILNRRQLKAGIENLLRNCILECDGSEDGIVEDFTYIKIRTGN